MDKRECLASYSYRYLGDWSCIAKALQNQEPPFSCEITEPYITIYDEAYPKCFRLLRFPPWVLFYRGDLSILERPCVTIVGSREMSPYGEKMTRQITNRLKQQFVCVSGLAKGVDATVHRCAIDEGRSIGVIGCGCDTHYPRENEDLYQVMGQHHLILSEYPRFVPVRRKHFPWRNRLLAALGSCVIVTQAKIHSGTMLTVNEANNLSKDVYVVPYPLQDPSGSGCNLLISQGAMILYDSIQLKEIGQGNPQSRKSRITVETMGES